jgi:thiosulfate/3-mercaptopyruvate sulfurtransferase
MTGPLISVSDVQELGVAVVLLDVRYRMGSEQGLADYVRGHIPGAVFVDLEADLADPPGEGGRHPLPDQAHFEAAMQRAGVSTGSPVVVYDDWSGHSAARAWWLLRHHGHQDVRVLDGGWRAWCAEGGEIATGDETVPPGDFVARPGGMPVLEAPDVLAFAERGVLIDARAPERYRGETEPVDPVAGRIPGAVNVPTPRNVDDLGRLRPAGELRQLYAAVGAVEGAEVAAYCGSGVTAALDVLALASIGVEAALYPGSWSHWITDPSRPVETGSPTSARP